jgi:Family of unknown function (DUF6282)
VIKLEGAIDMHCHYGPDFRRPGKTYQHSVTAVQAVREAGSAGQAAIVLKAHDFATPALAFALQEAVGGVRVFGGITLDAQAGGLNPVAVEQALLLGAKVVWLPTVSSFQDRTLNARARGGDVEGYPGARVIDDDEELLPVVREIMDLVVQSDAVLATGHVTVEEHFAVAKAFGRSGRLLVTHAGEQAAGPHLNASQCQELADYGAFIELTAQCCIPHLGCIPKSLPEMLSFLRRVGPDRCTLATDYGWHDALPHPVAGLQNFLDALWEVGVAEAELRCMACTNPAALLGIAG